MSSAIKQSYKVFGRLQSGFTLIEVLVAAFVLAVGIMGIVSLLSLSKVSQHASIQRVRAVVLANDIIERIRRNPAGMPVYNIGLSNPLGDASLGAEPVPNCHAGICTPIELAAHDLWSWERLLDGTSAIAIDSGEAMVGVRNVSACVNFTADTGKQNTGLVDVVIQWQGLKETADAANSGGMFCGNADGEDSTRRQVIVNSYVMDEIEL
jgi:type IV pilus assembly protein PilV